MNYGLDRSFPIRGVFLLLLLVITGCQNIPGGSVDSKTISRVDLPPPASADDVIVVDCLLPGQVRKLGSMTYLTPRRPVRVSTMECEIRGGEYVAYDRSDYRSALSVWLVEAEQGDEEAQNYVGEIYQRGLGADPRYDKAAQWFEKAASQGYSRAQINLAYLYENGLGVEKDTVKALNWYRKATGRGEEISIDTNGLESEEREELDRLRRQVEAQQQELRRLRRQIDSNQSKLDDARREFEWKSKQVEAERRGLKRAWSEFEHLKKGVGSPDQGELERLENLLKQRESIYESQRVAAANLKKKVKRLENDSARYRGQLERFKADDVDQNREISELKQEVKRRVAEADTLRNRLEQTADAMAAVKSDYEWQQKQIESERKRLEQTKKSLTLLKTQGLGKDHDEIQRLEAALVEQKALVAGQRQEASKLKEAMNRLSLKTKEYQKKLAAYEDSRTGKQQEIESLRAEVRRQKRQTETLQDLLQRTQDQMARAQREFDWKREQVEAERVGLQKAWSTLEKRKRTDAQSQQAELKRIETVLEKRKKVLDEQQKHADDLKAEIARLASEANQYKQELADYKAQAENLPSPQVELILPKLQATRSGQIVVTDDLADEIRLVGKVLAPAGLHSLSINDRLESSDDNGLFETLIPMNSSSVTDVRIVAIDNRGRRTDLYFQVKNERSANNGDPINRGVFGRYHALIIGNNAYDALPPLETAVADARTIATLLENKYGFETQALINATRYQVYLALDALRKKLTENDNLLIYYAGHGEIDKKNRRGYWLPVDADPDSHINSIPNYTVTDILNNMSVKQAMIIADTCYSGILTRSAVSHPRSGMSEKKRIEWLKETARTKSRTVLSSGGLNPVLDTGDGKHSIFAGALIDILEKNDDIIEASRLYRLIRDRVIEMSTRHGLRQVPQYAANLHAGHEAGDFLFVPVN